MIIIATIIIIIITNKTRENNTNNSNATTRSKVDQSHIPSHFPESKTKKIEICKLYVN